MNGRRELPRRSRAEVEGFRDGLAHELALRRARGASDPTGERSLRRAGELLRSGRIAEAERALVDLHRGLTEGVPERELSEYPKGLVSYVPRGGPESPTPPEDDPIRNRLILLERLVAVRASEGHSLGPIVRVLQSAAVALSNGDRAEAKRLGDTAHRELERLDSPERAPRRSEPAARGP